MRTISLLGSIASFALLAACTTRTVDETGSKPAPTGTDNGTSGTTTSGGTTTTPSTEDSNGEHPGGNAPAGTTTAPAGGTTVQSDTWTGTKDIPANITIAAGQTVTIDPGTIVTLGANVAITVAGTLKIAASASHAKMQSETTGTAWQGIVIASGGTLEADGLDIDGAAAALWTQAGNTAATYKDGTMTAQTPFKMEAGSTLTVDHSSITASEGSAIAGTFVATYMTYDKTIAGGLTLNDPAGTMSITDSTLTGQGGGDFVISDKGTKVSVAYTTITGSHCGFHFASVGSFAIDHVSSQGNSYGAMLYGSTTGGTITASNWRANNTVDIDFTKSANGAVTMTGSFIQTVPAGITATGAATAAVADAQPRPE